MVCIYCNSSTQVVNSRLQKQTNQVWRRRRCLSCNNIFTTHEAADLTSGVMVSYTGAKDLLPLHKERMLISVYECCKHRQSAIDDATHLTAIILSHLRPLMSTGKIQRNQIVTTTIQILKNFDKAAATMYEAYHPMA